MRRPAMDLKVIDMMLLVLATCDIGKLCGRILFLFTLKLWVEGSNID